MSIKQTIMAVSAASLFVATAVSGSFALTNDVTSKINVAEYGKGVEIEIIEQQRSAGNDSELEPFEQGKTLYPIIGGAQGDKDKWGMPTTEAATNFVDKIVRIQNTGEDSAYIRFFFAVPVGALGQNTPTNDVIHTSWGNRFDATGNGTYNEGSGWKTDWGWAYESNDEIRAEIDGVLYEIDNFVYETPLEPGEITSATLAGIYMDKNVDYENGCYTYDGKIIDVDFSQPFVLPVFAQAVSSSVADTADEAFKIAGMPDNPWAENSTLDVPQAAVAEEDLLDGGSVYLTEDVALEDEETTITAPITINLNGSSITSERSDISGADKLSTLTINNKATIEGDGVVENTAGYAISLRDAASDVTITGGTYKGGITAINVVKGNLTITGGFFQDINTEDNGHYLINCIDGNYKDGTATVTIVGGTFVNWNPNENTSEGDGTDFVPVGFKVVAEENGDDILYTVVKE